MVSMKSSADVKRMMTSRCYYDDEGQDNRADQPTEQRGGKRCTQCARALAFFRKRESIEDGRL
jgi:hypothetical protein